MYALSPDCVQKILILQSLIVTGIKLLSAILPSQLWTHFGNFVVIHWLFESVGHDGKHPQSDIMLCFVLAFASIQSTKEAHPVQASMDDYLTFIGHS